MPIVDDILKDVVDVTNNLENFVPFGVLFAYDWNGLPCPGIRSADNSNWCWLDFPYYEVDGLSPFFQDLRLLVRKGYARFTYRIFDNIAAIRVYLLPTHTTHDSLLSTYRERYFRFKKSLPWLEKKCLNILETLLCYVDYSNKAFHLTSSSHLMEYFKTTKIPLIRVISNTTEILPEIEGDEFNFHLKRLQESKPFDFFKNSSSPTHTTMQPRLNEIYQKIHSPIIKRDDIRNEDLLGMYDMIMSDEICGFKSTLYNFQKRSVLKMFEKEFIQKYRLMPNIIEIEGKCFFDIKSMLPVEKPPLFLPPRGGILAENMGLGKTCICLALICLSKFEVSETPAFYKHQKKYNNIPSLFDTCINTIAQRSISWKEYYNDFPISIVKKLETTVGYFEKPVVSNSKRNTRSLIKIKEVPRLKRLYLASTTLVVLPDNLFHQWKVEIFKHVQKDYLNILELQTNTEINKYKISDISKIVKNDLILISNSVFSKQFEMKDSILKNIYWKRLIIDEGHSMNSKTSRAVSLTKDLMYERMWIISGTPTSGLTNLHVENESQEYNVQRSFEPKQDLAKLGLIISNFFKIEPWSSKKKLWGETIIRSFENNDFNIGLQLLALLNLLIVRHSIKDVENDIKLPTLHHRPIFLKPSFFDKLSINLFISVLATNAVTSERNDVDYMFHPSNKSDLRRLVNNLQRATFYWTGFSINDVENLLNICVYSLRENSSKYSLYDQKLLRFSIFNAKLALSNLRWRAVTTVHEMGYFISNLPKQIVENYSLVTYDSNISVFGYPHLISIQKFFYKNRIIKTVRDLNEKILKISSDFWKNYWINLKGNKKSSKIAARALSNKEEYINFELSDVQMISEIPDWVETFNPNLEEDLLYSSESNGCKKRKVDSKKAKKTNNGPKNRKHRNIGLCMRDVNIVGTLSSKLNYLTLRLLENQMDGIKSIVFYEFENSAYYLTEFMDLLGMNYIMYSSYIKILDRSNNLAQFSRWNVKKNGGEGIVLIMDLKLASHGLTIIEATQIFFINPVWNQSIEAQAIKRSHRIGQMNEVFVETLILENTLEEEMYKARGNDVDTENENKNIELIDHTNIKNYILTFPFLKMYVDNSFNEEFSKLSIARSYDKFIQKESSAEDNELQLRKPRIDYNDNDINSWVLPLFTEKNMQKISTMNSKVSKIRYDDISSLEKAEMETSNIEKTKTFKLLAKLRSKRQRNVRFNV